MTMVDARRRSRRRKEWKNLLSGLVYLAPALIVFGVFLFYPAVKTGWLSAFTTNVRGLPKAFVGFGNYIDNLTSEGFLSSLRVTLLFALMVVPVTMIVALCLAVLANEKLRGIGFFRTVYAIPLAVSSAAAAVVWRLIFHPSQGILNSLLGVFGVEPVGWLTDPNVALISVSLTTIWMHLGFNFIVLLGGLQSLPTELYESAAIDGAGRMRQLTSITLPLLSPVLFFVGIVLVIDSFQSFGQIDILTQGGPAGATNLIVYEIYQNAFVRNRVGYASAQTIVLFVIILVLTAVQYRFSERKVHYQ
ncbi:sugar ABC transporter permease [Microbacterium sp. KUDC0406]|uniref:carbohydrate ABC transporter permease n=1 Tax=Microbacterium sp. KUDC0406 TaxID=2909588 RepID=UPI001F3558C1|nr:sugar ABC transporter permease [Microbacterium sp. KUDC0406]UJP09592.1 sugar ABC transporter permease [Microbacterium sp. KUDC0406]